MFSLLSTYFHIQMSSKTSQQQITHHFRKKKKKKTPRNVAGNECKKGNNRAQILDYN